MRSAEFGMRSGGKTLALPIPKTPHSELRIPHSNHAATRTSLDRRVVRLAAAPARGETLSARAHARAAVSLQPGLRRLREDPVSGRDSAEAAHARAMLVG